MAAGSRDQSAQMARFSHSLPQPHRQQFTPPSADEYDTEQDDDHLEKVRVQESRVDMLPCPGCKQEAVRVRSRRKMKGKEPIANLENQSNITIQASSTPAERAVMPFLTEHMPMQYNVPGSAPRAWMPHDHVEEDEEGHQERTNTKFCYRHRPDLKCRRQADEPTMKEIQTELATLTHTDQQAISHVWSLFSAAPSKHRNLMLQGILTQCGFPQLSSISAAVRDLIKIDFLSALPVELGFKILCYLDTTSLCKAAQVSQRWRSLADDDVVWHRMCEQHIDRRCTRCGWGLPLLEAKRLRIEKRVMQLRAKGAGIDSGERNRIVEVASSLVGGSESPSGQKRAIEDGAEEAESSKKQCVLPIAEEAGPSTLMPLMPVKRPVVPTRRPWKDVYKARFKVGTNWKYGRFSTRVFRGHTNGVMCLQFDDNHLITGSYDTTAKVWDIRTGTELRTLTGHTSGIRCLQFDEAKLMTGSLDNTIRLWNWKTGQCLRVFPAHTAGITTLHFVGAWVASGSMDQTVRVWNSETQQTFLLRGHRDWINCVKIDEASRTLFSSSDDLSVRLWDLDRKECIRVFEGHVGQVQQVMPLPAEFELDELRTGLATDKEDDSSSNASGETRDHRFHVRDHKRDTPGPHDDAPPFWPDDPDRSAPPRYMLTGALDATIRLWDVHFNAASQLPGNAPPPAGDTTGAGQPAVGTRGTPTSLPFRMLPTDPLTNSHTPRAQACVRTFFGHVEGIWALAADHLRLISGSEDRMLKVWDPRTGKCERTFTGHAGPVTCCWLSDWGVASGSEDTEVRMLCFGDNPL